MDKLLAASIACILSMMLSVVHAQDFQILGAGAESCGAWVSSSGDRRDIGLNWVLGFLTAMNVYDSLLRHDGDATKGTDAGGIETWVTNYCTSHPIENVSGATIQLYIELRKN